MSVRENQLVDKPPSQFYHPTYDFRRLCCVMDDGILVQRWTSDVVGELDVWMSVKPAGFTEQDGVRVVVP